MSTLRAAIALTLTVFCAATSLAVAAQKERLWQPGTLLDTERNRYFAGTYSTGNQHGNIETTDNPTGSSSTYNGSSSSSTTPLYRVYQNYVVEAGKYVYLVEERLRWRWSKPARLIVNAPLRFAVEKNKLWLMDEDGIEHETKIVKQVLKTESPEKK